MKKPLALFLALILLLSGLPALGFAQEDAPLIKADGDLSDWAGLWSLSPGEDKIALLYAFRTDSQLCIAFQAPDNTDISVYDIVLDLDNDAATGYQAEGRFKQAGGDFLIETWTGGWYDGGADGQAWEWQEADYPTIEKGASNDKTTVEVIVPLDVLNNPETIRMAVWTVDKDWQPIGHAPATGESFVTVPYYKEVLGAPITEPLSELKLEAVPGLRALDAGAMPGGLAGSLSAQGGDGATYDWSYKEDAGKGRDNDLFRLEGNQILTGDRPLAPGSYKLSLQVSSLIRKQSAGFILEVLPQDPTAEITTGIFDGDLGQWYAVPHAAAKQPPNLTALKAQTDGNRLYFFAAAEDLGDDYTIYLMNDAAPGMDLSATWPGASAQHKVTADGRLWVWENGAYTDTGRKATLSKTAKGVEGMVMAARLNNLAKAFGVAIEDGQGGQLPDPGQPMLQVTSPERLFAPNIKADSKADDWAELAPLAQGVGVVGDLYAARTEDTLFVRTQISGVSDPEDDLAFSINILIDADGDPTNGFHHPGYPAHSGIDILVQDWHSLNLEYFIFQKPSEEWFSCVSRSPEGIKKAVESLGDDKWLLEYAIPISLIREQLPEVSDDFYIALDRITDMQPGTTQGAAPALDLPGGGLVKVPKYRTTVSHLSVQDGSFFDWDGVGNRASAAAQSLAENLYATLSQEKLYVLASGQGMNASHTLDISTDKGARYTVRDSALYDADGQFLSDVYSYIQGDRTALQIYLEDLGEPETVDLRFQGSGLDLSLHCEERFTLSKDEGLVYPKESFALMSNPYHGWAAWASVDPKDRIAQPFQTAFLDIKWAEFEPEKGQYNFDILEKTYRLSHWKEEGVRFLLRFVMDDVAPTHGQQRMDIPAWLYEELVAENHLGKGAGTFYDEPEQLGGGGFSPNYQSPILIERHRLAIQALAERFDDPAITAFVQVGSLGHWAEMHTWPDGTGEFPDPDLVGEYMAAYSEAFKQVKLAARKPYPYASAHNWGLYNDMFGDVGATDTFRDYFLNGCTDMPHATADHVQASKMPDFWHHGYSGGEFAEGNIRKWITDEAIGETLRLIKESHASLIGPCSPTDLLETQADAHDWDANLDAMRRQMGYRFTVESLTRIDKAQAGDSLPLAITWLNRGNAPFYYPWPVQLSLASASGEPVHQQTLTTDVTKLLPGRTTVHETLSLPQDLPPGEYSLQVAILDPATNAPAIHLALADGARDYCHELQRFTVE